MAENCFFAYVLIPIGLCLFFNFIKFIYRMHKNRKLETARGEHVRRTTVYTITADPRGNDAANDFTDFFWDGLPHASSSQNEAKDDKDLPTYEQVMQLEMTRRAVGSTTVTPGNNNTATSSVVVPVIPVVAASTV